LGSLSTNSVRSMISENSRLAWPGYGTLVVSLDFELHWGVRDSVRADGPYRANPLGARHAIPRILDIIEEFDIAATRATVSFLFAHPAGTRRTFSSHPPQLPESKARSLPGDHWPWRSQRPVRLRRQPSGRNPPPSPAGIATHTSSHYYCQEDGQTRSAFREDLDSAMRIAKRYGIKSMPIGWAGSLAPSPVSEW
jgi:hypothetical protein